MTVRELTAFAKGRARASKEEWHRAAFIAWQIAAHIGSGKKLVKWQKIDRQFNPPKPQTPQQMMAIARALTAAWGGIDKTQEG